MKKLLFLSILLLLGVKGYTQNQEYLTYMKSVEKLTKLIKQKGGLYCGFSGEPTSVPELFINGVDIISYDGTELWVLVPILAPTPEIEAKFYLIDPVNQSGQPYLFQGNERKKVSLSEKQARVDSLILMIKELPLEKVVYERKDVKKVIKSKKVIVTPAVDTKKWKQDCYEFSISLVKGSDTTAFLFSAHLPVSWAFQTKGRKIDAEKFLKMCLE